MAGRGKRRWRGGHSGQPGGGRTHHVFAPAGPSAQTALHLWPAPACHPGRLAVPGGRHQQLPLPASSHQGGLLSCPARFDTASGVRRLNLNKHDDGRERCLVLDGNVNIHTLAFRNFDTVTARVCVRTSDRHTSHLSAQPGRPLPGTPGPPVSHAPAGAGDWSRATSAPMQHHKGDRVSRFK